MVALAAAVVVACSDQQQASPPPVLHRRSANYHPSTWDYDSICSLREAAAGGHDEREQLPNNEAESSLQAALRHRVRQLLLNEEEELPTTTRLVIIDQLQRLGVAYHFEEEIKSILISMHHGPKDDLDLDLDLSSAALVFRLLRGHGIPAAPTDMLSAFFGGGNNQKAAKDDMDGLLALYEASYLAFPGEAAVLDEARVFAVENLQRRQQAPSFMDALPLQWTAPRLRAMWSLRADYCCDDDDDKSIDPAIVQLAKADFNLVQAVHRGELVKIIKWWKESGLGEKLAFARDRVVECFFCAACVAPEPHLGECREVLAKTSALIVHLDDIYDLYGTPDELQAFTDAIGRWDNVSAAAAAGALPEYMEAMYSAIWKTSVTAADRVLHKQGYHVLPLYKKAHHLKN